MKRKFLVTMLLFVMAMSLVACNSGAPATTSDPSGGSEAADTIDLGFKIGILTGTVSQNEEEYRAAQNVVAKYGEDNIVLMTYPDKFMDEQETTIANILSMASDPEVKAIVIVQAVPGVSAGIDRAREIRDDLLIIAGTPGEDPAMIAEKADIVFAADELAMGTTIIEQAFKQGAQTFVHYSFPRHMSYALLSARRDLFRENCERLGIEFVDATAPDPTSDAGVAGAQQFILEDVPRMVIEYGKDTAFFATNCSMQVPLISSVVAEGAIYPQPCCPSPYHGFPSALGIEIPEDKKGDIGYVVSEITRIIDEAGCSGRLSTWPVPINMMYVEAGVEYAIDYVNGETNGILDVEHIQQVFEEYANVEISIAPLEDGGILYDNYLMVLLDFLNF